MALYKSIRLLAMLLLFIVAVSIPFSHSNSASAPFIDSISYGNARWDPVNNPAATSGDADEEADAADDPEPPPVSPPAPPESAEPSQPPVINDYVTLQMTESDFFQGFLLLVNQDYEYDIGNTGELVSVSEHNTGSYRVESDGIYVCSSIIEPLNAMMDAYFNETGRDNVTVISGYRSYLKQQEILSDYIKLLGEAEGRKWAAAPRHSEHHTGLAIDFGVFNGSAVRTFTGTGATAWFYENSYKYGFILRFPGDKTKITGTADEPWHFRYIGNPHAKLVYDNGWCLEEYIGFIMTFTYDEPYATTYNGDSYEIYYTSDTELRIPFDCEFDLSGNNIGGLIVTIKYDKPDVPTGLSE